MYAGNSVVVNILMRWPQLIPIAAAGGLTVTAIAIEPTVTVRPLIMHAEPLNIPADLPTVILKAPVEVQQPPEPLPAPEKKIRG